MTLISVSKKIFSNMKATHKHCVFFRAFRFSLTAED